MELQVSLTLACSRSSVLISVQKLLESEQCSSQNDVTEVPRYHDECFWVLCLETCDGVDDLIHEQCV